MAKRNLPGPEEYGRRLAQARRREEKKRHEGVKRTEDVITRAFDALNTQIGQAVELLTRLQATVDAPADDSALKDVGERLEELINRQKVLEEAVNALPMPSLTQETVDIEPFLIALGEVKSDIRALNAPSSPGVQETSPTPSMSLAGAGPLDLTVVSRDSNGDIETVRIDPVIH